MNKYVIMFLVVILLSLVTALETSNPRIVNLDPFPQVITGGGGAGNLSATSSHYLFDNGVTVFFDETLLNNTIDDRATGLGDNESWNQTLASILYEPIGITESDISDLTHTSAGNLSWNQTLADTLYSIGAHTIDTNRTDAQILGVCTVYNETSWVLAQGYGNDNSSWNQTLADTLYSVGAHTSAGNLSWNETLASILYEPIGITESDISDLTHTLDGNLSWNQTLANTLYAIIGSGNLSWNQTLADLLYEPLGITESDISDLTHTSPGNLSWNRSVADILYEPLGITESDISDLTHTSPGNLSWNQTLADSLYAIIGSGNLSWNETLADLLYEPLGITESDISDLTHTPAGNLSWNQTLADTLYSVGGHLTDSFIDDSELPLANRTTPHCSNITGADYDVCIGDGVAGNDGNASSICSGSTTYLDGEGNCDDISLVYSTGAHTSAGNLSWNRSIADTLYEPIGITESDISDLIHTSAGNLSWNRSIADTLYAEIGATGDNSSWNESYARIIFYDSEVDLTTLLDDNYAGIEWDYNETIEAMSYADVQDSFYNISLTNYVDAQDHTNADNSSWNESYAREIFYDSELDLTTLLDDNYADISVTGDNVSWNQTLADLLYEPLGITESDISDLTHTSPGNLSWNRSIADSLYAIIGSGNLSWNETLADTLYEPLGITESDISDLTHTSPGNLSWNRSIADTLYAEIGTAGDNVSWNESYARIIFYDSEGELTTLLDDNYAGIQWGYNQTIEAMSYADVQDSFYNISLTNYVDAQDHTSGDNVSWNESYADLLYANIVWSYNQTTEAITYCDATFQVTLTNEAGLYSALSDVSEFIETSDAGTLVTLDTGQGANELYDMDQNVLITSDVIFNEINITTNITDLDCIIFASGGKICSGV